MTSEFVTTAANICQCTVPVISLLAYIPQWTKLWRTRSSASISVSAWFTWTISSIFGLFYAIVQLILNGRGWALVISSGLGLFFVCSTLFLVVKFRARRTVNQSSRHSSNLSDLSAAEESL